MGELKIKRDFSAYLFEFPDTQTYLQFKYDFKILSKEFGIRRGYNSVKVPRDSRIEDYSQVYLFLMHNDVESYHDLLKEYKLFMKKELNQEPVIELYTLFRDKDVPLKLPDKEVHFM